MQTFPDLLVMTDLCLCAYTTHGHCGIVHEDGSINNTESIARLAAMAVQYCHAGAQVCTSWQARLWT